MIIDNQPKSYFASQLTTLDFRRFDFEPGSPNGQQCWECLCALVALRHYRSLAEAGRCNQKTLDFFIRLCEEQLNQVDHVRGSPPLQVVSSGSEYRLKEVERIRASAIFDERFYSNVYGHKISSGMSALEDFCSRGWRARRDPNPFFSKLVGSGLEAKIPRESLLIKLWMRVTKKVIFAIFFYH